MEKGIYEEVLKYRSGNIESLEKIINIFSAIINKFSRLLDGEDTKQDLIMFTINVINNMSLQNKSFFEDRIIFTYISKSIRNEYIKLSQKSEKIKINEKEIDLDIEIGYEEFESELEILDLFKILSDKEGYIMKLIYVHYLSISEVADFMMISRQAVNQTKNRALKKLRETYLS